jgi:hypothetical protein
MTRPPYIFAASRERGFALIEAIIGAALICGLSLALYNIFQPASSSASVKTEAVRLDQLRKKVSALYITAPDFSGIAQDPSLSVDTSAASWGGVSLSSTMFTTGSDGWAATYSKVPTDACEKLVLSQLGALWTEIEVGGKSVSTAPAGLTLCQASATSTVRFAIWGGLRGSAGVGSLFPPGAPHAPAAPVGVPMPPVGVAGSSTPAPPAPTSPTPPAPIAGPVGTPAPVPVAPPKPVYPPCVAPAPGMQTVACPNGQISSVSPYGPNGISQQRVATCVAPTGPNFTWGPWTTVSDTCAPVCVAPATVNSTATQTITVNPGCPSGQTGSYHYSQNQTRTATTTYSCPAPTGPYTTNPTTYSGWVNSGGGYNVVNTCAPNCVVPATVNTPQSQTITVTLGCPSGQTGSYYYSQNQTRTATTTYSCPAPTGPYTTNPTTYSGWVNSGGGYNVVNTCVTPPPACVTSVGQFAVTSFKLTITSAEGSSASTTTIGSPVHAGSSSYNLSGLATVTGTYGGVSYTISSLTGTEYAQVSASANCPVYAVASGCNPTHTGSLPPGLDFEMDLFGESQGVAYMKTRTCP